MIKYACVYYVYGGREVDFESDLENLVRTDYYDSDQGNRYTHGFYEMTDDGWQSIDVNDIRDDIRRREDEMYKEYRQEADKRIWKAYVTGPESSEVFWGSFLTEQEAVDALLGFHENIKYRLFKA